ncbi:hypothetical protein DHEL01_v210499 [Diaporthe helianthi]|uniref:Uncharacterized protein n=1 Tax=Diaporthe helianthi TaxID=158607 RepID=A0A2P5HLH9_DIAHE|nr:hypothetical protein DHEL01_v210499 [Diaporthe helianthi]
MQTKQTAIVAAFVLTGTHGAPAMKHASQAVPADSDKVWSLISEKRGVSDAKDDKVWFLISEKRDAESDANDDKVWSLISE